MSAMTKKILVLNGNPKTSSYSKHLSDLYEIEAREYFEIKRFDVSAMGFNPSLDCGYDGKQDLEACLLEFQNAIAWADHLVIVTPIWWGGLPAKFKGLLERTFLPGFSFQFESGSPLPIPLLKGKTARVIITMDTPKDHAQEEAAAVIAQLDLYTLQFCGFEKAEINLFAPIISATPEEKQEWEKRIKTVGAKGE